MSRVDEVRAELGEDNVNELMDAYYTSGLSLKDLRELYDLPKSFTDEKIVELFPMIELDDGCPLCGGAPKLRQNQTTSNARARRARAEEQAASRILKRAEGVRMG